MVSHSIYFWIFLLLKEMKSTTPQNLEFQIFSILNLDFLGPFYHWKPFLMIFETDFWKFYFVKVNLYSRILKRKIDSWQTTLRISFKGWIRKVKKYFWTNKYLFNPTTTTHHCDSHNSVFRRIYTSAWSKLYHCVYHCMYPRYIITGNELGFMNF